MGHLLLPLTRTHDFGSRGDRVERSSRFGWARDRTVQRASDGWRSVSAVGWAGGAPILSLSWPNFPFPLLRLRSIAALARSQLPPLPPPSSLALPSTPVPRASPARALTSAPPRTLVTAAAAPTPAVDRAGCLRLLLPIRKTGKADSVRPLRSPESSPRR